MKNMALQNVLSGVKKKSPEILLASGIVGIVSSTVLACYKTTKLKPILDEAKKQIKAIHEKNDQETMKKELTAVYFRTCYKVTKLYLPSVVIGSLSITSIVTSNNVLKKKKCCSCCGVCCCRQRVQTVQK